MSRSRSICSTFLGHLDEFIAGTLRSVARRRASRLVPSELSAHVARCADCSNALSQRLLELGYGDDASVGSAAGPTVEWRAPRSRRWTTIAMRVGETDFAAIREHVGRVVARRALRYLAAQDGRRLEAATEAAEEIVDAQAAVARLNAIAAAFDDEIAAEMAEFAARLADAEHMAESFADVRASGILVPRPPALPQRTDRLGRDRLLAWAARMLNRPRSA